MPAQATRSIYAVTRRAAVLALLASAPVAMQAADTPTPAGTVSTANISEGFHFIEKDGESLYRAICQGCHMSDGQGAKGAGMYPALAKNPRLAAAAYPVVNILQGYKGMPSFKMMLTDEQVADVTNYVRTHMGNSYKDAVKPADVKALR